jgi:histidinol-phosphate aminotransferase
VSSPKPRASILEIAAYKPGRSKAGAGVAARKLSANESALGTSPRAREAFIDAAMNLHRYPDGSTTLLRQALAGKFGTTPERVICGHGSDDLIELLAIAYCGTGDEVIVTEHAFLIYSIAARTAGATPVVVPENGLRTDIEAILKGVTARTRMVFIANPNNPTGTYITKDEVSDLRARLRDDILLVVDAAYSEFADPADYTSGLELARETGNVVMLRTFSKAYGLANLRLGWGCAAPEIIDILNRIRGPFNVSGPAQAAGVAALEDEAFMARALAHNAEWRQWYTEELTKLGLDVVPSVANFLLFQFPEGDRSAARADEYLTKQGLLLRRTDEYLLPNSLRVTVGTQEENRAVIAALTAFMNGDR